MQAYINTWNKYNITHNLLYNSNRTKKLTNLLLDHFWTQLKVSLQICHPGATQLFPEETYYKAYILGELKFSYCICIKLAVQVRFLPFFWLCHVPSATAKSLWSVRTTYQQQIPHPFYQSLKVYKIPQELQWGPYKIHKGFLVCFVLKLRGFCLKIQMLKVI